MSIFRRKLPFDPLAPNIFARYNRETRCWRIFPKAKSRELLKSQYFSQTDSETGDELRDKDAFQQLLALHYELDIYLLTRELNDDEAPYIFQERFSTLALTANKLYPVLLTPDLTKREMERLFAQLRVKARELTEEFNALYEDLLYQAEHDPGADRYGRLMQELAQLEVKDTEEGQRYRELSTTYKNYVLD